MAKYECKTCGYIYDEEQAGKPFSEILECPICNQGREDFSLIEEEEVFFDCEEEEVPTNVIKANSVDASNVEEAVFRNVAEEEIHSESAYTAPQQMNEYTAPQQESEYTAPQQMNEYTAPQQESAYTAPQQMNEYTAPQQESAYTAPQQMNEYTAPQQESAYTAPQQMNEYTASQQENTYEASEQSIEPALDTTTEYVVEKRQEFWSPYVGKEDKTEENKEQSAFHSWGMGGLGSVERVINSEPMKDEPSVNVMGEVKQEAIKEENEEIKEENEAIKEENEEINEQVSKEAPEQVTRESSNDTEQETQTISSDPMEILYDSNEIPKSEFVIHLGSGTTSQPQEDAFKPIWTMSGLGAVQTVLDAPNEKEDSKQEGSDSAYFFDDEEQSEQESNQNEESATTIEDAFASDEESVMKSEEPFIKEEEPTVMAEEPSIKEEEPTVMAEEPSIKEEEPTPIKESFGETLYRKKNSLDDIFILPAQLNPMPLSQDVEVDSKTILGRMAAKPIVLEQPIFVSGSKNVLEYIPNCGLTSEDFQNADAIEIIVGKGNGVERTINTKEDLRQMINLLRLESDGCPIGIRIEAGRIERDLEFCVYAKPDFVLLDGFEVVPLAYALYRAVKFLNIVQSDIDLLIRVKEMKDALSFAKSLAMGADAIVVDSDYTNLEEVTNELKNYARIAGHYDVSDLNVRDLCTVNREIAEYTNISHV